jgi:hypothetical protein
MKTRAAVQRNSKRAMGFFLALAFLGAGIRLEAGQSGPDPRLAAKILKKKTITVFTPSYIVQIQDPLLIPGGLKSGSGPSMVVPWSRIQKIRYRGRGTLTGMWIGAGLVGALGAAWGIAWMVDEHVDVLEILAGTCIFGAVGGGAGAFIGLMFPKWTTLYKAPAQPPLVARISLAPVRDGGMSMSLSLAF